MKWSDLPKEYQDLEKKYSKLVFNFPESDQLNYRYRFKDTNEGFDFWVKCHYAKTIADLPKIEVTDYPDIKEPEKKERYFIVFWRSQNEYTHEVFETQGSYINQNKFYEDNPNTIITNIIELSESDYNDFIA